MAGSSHQPSIPRVVRDFCMAGISWTNNFVPNGASSVALTLKDPSGWEYADMFGFNLEGRSKLRVNSTWCSKRHQYWRGNFSSVLPSHTMKWFLKVLLERSAQFLRYCFRGTSWYSICLLLYSFIVGGSSLSNLWCGRF